MNEAVVIQPLRPFTLEEILPIVTGYETDEQYRVEKTESDEQTLFKIRLIRLEEPYRSSFVSDFEEEDFQRYLNMVSLGVSFGAYHQDRLVAFAICEVMDWNHTLRIWEFQVMEAFRGQGIGRALMEQVFKKARQENLIQIFLETQNTNVKAVRFYRKMGFSLDSIDLSHYFGLAEHEGVVAFFMKRALP